MVPPFARRQDGVGERGGAADRIEDVIGAAPVRQFTNGISGFAGRLHDLGSAEHSRDL